jgi:hypothetical protein
MRYLVLMMVCVAAGVSGCGLAPVLSTPTPYEASIPAEFNIAKDAQGKIAVVVQGGDIESTRQALTDVILLELEKNADVKKARLVPRSAIDAIKKDEEKYLAMTKVQVGAVAGAETVLVVKIVNYGLYPVPMGGYYDGSIKASASLVDVRTATLLWPRDGIGHEVSISFDAERGGADVMRAKLLTSAGHAIVRYLYDCSQAGFRTPGEHRSSEWEN